MSRLDTLERLFFSEVPRTLLAASALTFASGVFGALALGWFAENGFEVAHLRFAALIAVPAVLMALLSFAIKHRHKVTVPLTLALCAVIVWLFFGNPTEAAQGVSPYYPTLIGVWAVTILEAIALLLVIGFVIYLWLKGSLS